MDEQDKLKRAMDFIQNLLRQLSPGSMAPRTGGIPDSAALARNITADNGMAMSMGDPSRARPQTKIPNAYRGPLVGAGALNDLPQPGYPEQWNRGI